MIGGDFFLHTAWVSITVLQLNFLIGDILVMDYSRYEATLDSGHGYSMRQSFQTVDNKNINFGPKMQRSSLLKGKVADVKL